MTEKTELKSVLITGASRGIGFACADTLAARACKQLCLTGRNVEQLKQAKDTLEQRYPGLLVDTYLCDHDSLDDIQRLVFELLDKDQLLDGVISNVGYNPFHDVGPRKISSTSTELLLKTFQTNVAHTHALLSPLLKYFQRHGGSIALIGSQAYLHGVKGQVAYNVSKAALVGYKNTLVSEYGAKGVFCHLINPGVVENDRTRKLRDKFKDLEMVSEQDVANVICNSLLQTDKNGLEINI